MKILITHNAYRERGGEDTCVANETAALRSEGIDVSVFQVQTDQGVGVMMNAARAPWGNKYEERLEATLTEQSPDVLHVHNLYPLLSARIFKCAKKLGIRTVQTLHNFRPICLNGLFMTPKLEICERCSPDNHIPGIIRGCYRDSVVQSAGLAAHLAAATIGHWYDHVDAFISPSQFLKRKYEQFKPFQGRIMVQGHYVPFTTLEPPHPAAPYVLYLGRLSEEKGVRWILQQFKHPPMKIKLILAGDGPMLEEVLGSTGESIEYAGYVKEEAKEILLSSALAVVMPSECYENFPMALAEANLRGVSGLVPNHGGLGERIQSGINGEHYQPRDPDSFWVSLQRIQDQTNIHNYRLECQKQAMLEFSKESFIKRRIELYQTA